MMHLFCGLRLFPFCFHIMVLAIFFALLSMDLLGSFDLLYGRSTYISMSVYICMYIIFILRLCASQKSLDPVLMSMSLCTVTFISIWVMGQQKRWRELDRVNFFKWSYMIYVISIQCWKWNAESQSGTKQTCSWVKSSRYSGASQGCEGQCRPHRCRDLRLGGVHYNVQCTMYTTIYN